MNAPTRSRQGRDRRGPASSARAERARQEQDAAYETAKEIRYRAAARRDAEWKAVAAANRRRTMVVMFVPVAVFAVLGALGFVSEVAGLAALLIALAWALFALVTWVRASSDLASSLGGGTPLEAVAAGQVTRLGAERLADLAEQLCAVLGLPIPEMRIIPDRQPNAITVGIRPEETVLAVTSGLVDLLDRIELEAVLAHELSHVKRLDIVPAALVASPVGRLIRAFGGERAMEWLEGPDREARADVVGVSATHYPPGLISAVERMAATGDCKPASVSPRVVGRTANTWLMPLNAGIGTPSVNDRLDLLREL